MANVSRRGFLAFMATAAASAATAPVIAALPPEAMAPSIGAPRIAIGMSAYHVAPGAQVTVRHHFVPPCRLRSLHVSDLSSPHFAILEMPDREVFQRGDTIEMVVRNQSNETRSFFASWWGDA